MNTFIDCVEGFHALLGWSVFAGAMYILVRGIGQLAAYIYLTM